MKFSTKHLNGERRVINGVKVLFWPQASQNLNPKKKARLKKKYTTLKRKFNAPP